MVSRYLATFPWRSWLWLWLGVTILMVAGRVVVGDTSGVLFWLAQSGFWLLLSFIAVPRRYLSILFCLALLVLSVGGGLQRWLFANTWRNAAGENTNLSLNSITLEGGNERAAMRTWRLSEETDNLELTFQTRLLSGQPGLAWYGENTQTLTKDGETFLRWQSSPDTTLSRRYVLAEPLGGKEVLLRLTLRSSEDGCGRVKLAERISKARNVSEVCLTPTPQTITQTWKVPADVTGTLLNVTLVNFSMPVDILAASLELDGALLSLPAPSGAALGMAWRGNAQAPAELRFLPEENWQTHQLQVRVPAGVSQFTTYVQLEPGISMELRNLQVNSLSNAPSPTPLSGLTRQALGTPHVNLAGHMLATLSLTLLALAIPAWLTGLVLFLSVFGIALTGSRTAFLALSLFAPSLFLFKVKKRWLGYLVLILGMAFAAFIVLPHFERLTVFELDGFDRFAIWRLAWDVFVQHPWTGVDSVTFQSLALESGLGLELGGVGHAHNLWLYLASSYGVFGFMAGVWLMLGLVYIAWRGVSWTGLVLVCAVLLMNVFDVSFIYVGVSLPLIFALNTLWAHRVHQHEKN